MNVLKLSVVMLNVVVPFQDSQKHLQIVIVFQCVITLTVVKLSVVAPPQVLENFFLQKMIRVRNYF